jgi:FOG: CheY-like receiver
MECCSRGKNTAFLILSSKYIGRDSIRVQWPSGFKVVDIINRPCGPHKLARFIQRCLDKDTRHETIETTSLAEGLANSDLNGRPSSNHESQESGTQSSSTTSSEISLSTLNTETTESIEGTDPPEAPRGTRILVVEDNKINLNLMLAFLKKGDFATVDSAENGRLAVSAVKQEQQGYDVIFMGKILAHPYSFPALPLTNVRYFHASYERLRSHPQHSCLREVASGRGKTVHDHRVDGPQ